MGGGFCPVPVVLREFFLEMLLILHRLISLSSVNSVLLASAVKSSSLDSDPLGITYDYYVSLDKLLTFAKSQVVPSVQWGQ